jgi:hypothetical protein
VGSLQRQTENHAETYPKLVKLTATYTNQNKMLNTVKYLSLGSLLAMAVFVAFMTMNNKPGHTCRWALCPYKGVTRAQAHDAVSNYVGETLTDAYKIDMLHIKYPTLDADQLDSLLTLKY